MKSSERQHSAAGSQSSCSTLMMLALTILIHATFADGAHARSCWCEESACTSAAHSSLHCSTRYLHSSAGSFLSLTGFHLSVGALT